MEKGLLDIEQIKRRASLILIEKLNRSHLYLSKTSGKDTEFRSFDYGTIPKKIGTRLAVVKSNKIPQPDHLSSSFDSVFND